MAHLGGPLRIGIDAKWFFNGPPSGRLVVRNHVKCLAALNSPHELFVLLDARAMNRPFPVSHERLHAVYVWGGNNLLSNIWCLPRVARRLGLDVLICQNFTPYNASCARVACIYDVIFASHPEYYSLRERIYFYPLKTLSRRAERVCVNSHSERERLLRYGYAREGAVDVVGLGVDPRFRPREQHPPEHLTAIKAQLGLPDRFLLFVGRLNVRKNLLNLARAVRLLREPHIPLLVVGVPDRRTDDLREAISGLGIAPRVKLVGRVTDEDLAGVYALATVFCFPSFEEGFGLPPLEAMASGIPAVVSHGSSMPEVCGEAASYADPDDPQSIANAIDRLLGDPVFAGRQRIAGLERAKHFTWEAAARGLLASAEAAAASRP